MSSVQHTRATVFHLSPHCRRTLDLALEPIEKWDFYEAVNTSDHVLTIQTADQQRFANLLLTIGVRMDD